MKNAILIFLVTFFLPFLLHAQPTLIGACSYGGNQFGTILSYTVGDTTFDKVYKFNGIVGAKPSQGKFIEVGGFLYSTSSEGGLFNLGVLFKYDLNTNSYIKLHDFTVSSGNSPHGSMMIASNGKMYGMTLKGGLYDKGVIFEFDHVTNTYTKKIDLSAPEGCYPYGNSFIETSNGKLYGMTSSGGAMDKGVIFEYDFVNNIYTKKKDFSIVDGSNPAGSFIEASNGKLYGMTNSGGANSGGIIFEYDYTTNIFVKKFDFIVSEGYTPQGSLFEAANGKMYGVTYGGGIYNGGVLFEFDYILNLYVKKIDFDASTGNHPGSSLMEASNGRIYGTTSAGGSISGYGTLFEYQYNNNGFQLKVDFLNINCLSTKTELIQASNGKLYGMTEGGSMNKGAIYEYNINTNTALRKISFSTSEGSTMSGSLIKASNGKFYGMTFTGGINNSGVIFEYDYGTNTYTVKFIFGAQNGMQPKGSLIEAANGKLYGMTYRGGSNYSGVIFEYDYTTNVYTKKIDLSSNLGINPIGDLIEAPNNKLYGMTSKGGLGNGVIFEYDYISNVYTKKIDLAYIPYGSLVIASNNKMYGMNSEGGINDGGSIFEYDYINNVYTYKVALDHIYSSGSFVEGNNKLYALAENQIIEYDFINDTMIVKHIFFQSYCRGSLMISSNSLMYGMTYDGGIYDEGTIFQYDYVNNTYSKLIDLEKSVSGSNPLYTTLVEVNCIAPYIVPSGPTSFCRGGNVTLNSGSVGSSYQWNRNGNLIPGANSSSLLVTNPGKYSVTVTDSNCVSTLTSNAIRVTIPCFPPFDPQEKIAAEEIDEDATAFYSYYESSNKNLILWAENLKGTTYQISVFNNTGKLLVTENGNINNGELEHQLDCSKFASGLYIVKLSTNIEQFTKKFVKGN